MSSGVSLFFAGDFCSRPSTSRIKVSQELKNLIQSCDVRVVNFEVPLKPDGSFAKQSRERYYQNDDTVGFLKELGFNLFSLANNHAFDWDEAGFLKTKTALGDGAFGAGLYEEACRVKVVELGSLRIGFLGVCFAAYKGVFSDVRNREGLGCLYINDFKVNHIIIEAKKTCDFLFVLPHDGIEYIDIPMPETIARYRDFIDYGADGVIASHPHCPQGWESYKGKPIFYSLGNFLFNSKEGYDYRATDRPHWYEGLCVVITVSDGFLSWKVINTRNTDNVGIEIDHDPIRNEHNASLCGFLEDKEKYDVCLKTVCKELGQKEVSLVDRTIHMQSLDDCTRLIVKMWVDKIRGRSNSKDYPLLRLLAHDARRSLLYWTLKKK